MSTFKLGDLDEESLFSEMEEAEKNGYLMLAYSDEVNLDQKNANKTYFDNDYFYPIVASFRADLQRMIFLRNIWNKAEFPGVLYNKNENYSSEIIQVMEKYNDTSIIMMGKFLLINRQ